MISRSINWNDLFLFSQVVKHQGFTAAGDALGLPKSHVSRRIAGLERQMGARLLERSARKLRLTDAGQTLHGHCLLMIEEAEAGVLAVQQRQQQVRGQVRLSLPVALADAASRHLLPRFMAQHPAVNLSVQATNRSVDLLAEHIDVVVRGLGVEGQSSPASMVRSCVCTATWVMVCSPAYLAQSGPLTQLSDLSRIDSLLYSPNKPGTPVLKLIGADMELASVRVRPRFESDNLLALRQAAIAGLGVCGLPVYACADDLASGRLQIVLAPWRPQAGHLVVMFPSRQGLAPATRALIEFLKQELPALVS